uniref:N/A n=1 Tax=Ganoderma boninense TaxID=34458 RepID=A0A5K1K242_9APHY|nr:N/A [Ganoderma boninense]
MIDSMRAFPPLPSELVIHVFEIAACNYPQAAQAISRVSTWARKIALPHLFSTVIYRPKPAFSHGMSSGANDSPNARPLRPLAWGHLVRNLWMESSGISNPTNEGEMFRACTNVENLALMSQSLRALAPSIQAQNLARLKASAGGPTLPPDAFPCRLRSMTLITHTFRYDWHFLVGLRLQDGSELLHNITHLRILDMTISAFAPHNLLSNLTHLALPYLDLGNDFKQDTLRLPPGVLEHRALRMIVLTVEEKKWLTNPWYQISWYPRKTTTSPKATFRLLVEWLRNKDDRLYAVLSPRIGDEPCKEWANAARGGPSVWEMATQARADDSHGANLPVSYPKDAQR